MEHTNNKHFDLNKYITNDSYYMEQDAVYSDVFSELELHFKNISTQPSPIQERSPYTNLIIPDDDTDIELESNPPTPKNIQSSIDFSKINLLISSHYDKKQYKRPPKSSRDARKIWKYAKIKPIATIWEIEYKLLDWAFTYASLEIVDMKINKISWHTYSKCLCSSPWSTFLQWILCASKSC